MSWVPVAFAALLLMAVSYPFVAPVLARERRARRAHQGARVHWYPNYDENLHFEPRMETDIVAVRRGDLAALGYRPGAESALVPRTFRRRVPGDHRFRLWTSVDVDLRPLWICCWSGVDLPATSPPGTETATLTREMLLRIDSGPREAINAAAPRVRPDSPHRVPRLGEWMNEQTSAPRVAREPARMPQHKATPPRRGRRSRTKRPRTKPSRTRR